MQPRQISALANPSASKQSRCSSPHICAPANLPSAWPICALAIHCTSHQYRRFAIPVVAIPRPIRALPLPISAYLGNAAASQSFALVAIQCLRFVNLRQANPICAFATLSRSSPLPFSPLQCLCTQCQSFPWRFSAIPPLFDPWRPLLIRRPGHAGQCFAAAKHLRTSRFASWLIGATPCVAFAYPGCS